MKLISLQIIGAQANGWSSRKLDFADHVTQLFGPNGCGKTPVVQSIVYALGYKVEYRDDVLEHCEEVKLKVAVGDLTYVITRRMSGPFDILVESSNGETASFFSEREYSRFLFSLWGLEDPVVTSVSNVAAHLYVAHFLPLFYLDQDRGYADPYYSSSKFIKDQYPEVTRLAFKLISKNSFDKRRLRNELKDKLEYLDRAVFRSEKEISELAAEISGPRRPVGEIDRDLQAAITGLEALQDSGGVIEKTEMEFDTRTIQLQRTMHALTQQRSELEARMRGFSKIKHEIEVESDTLSLNEEARLVFASFDAICSNENCGLFVRSSLTYGKSLLYLRDQIKDLERSNTYHQRRIDDISTQIVGLEAEISSIRRNREGLAGQSSVSVLVGAVSKLTEDVIQLKRARQIEEELVRIEVLYVDRLEERNRLQMRLAGLEGSAGVADIELLKLRNELCERISVWLRILRTSNVSSEISVDNDFNVTFGGQKVSKFKGSTLTRIVLAIRTATFELLSSKDGTAPRFFILDAPRQQDITRDDLAAYIGELKRLAISVSAQIIFSTSNYRYELSDGDAEWMPDFPGSDHPMFLGETIGAVQ